MEFYTPFSEARPVRLSAHTRQFAHDSVHGKYGLETMQTPCVVLDREQYASLPSIDQYDAAIEKIVREAPLRFCEHEMISGAATLGMAVQHMVPAKMSDDPEGHWSIQSVSHLTIDFFEVLAVGYEGIEARAKSCAENNSDSSRQRFYERVLHCLNCFRIYHQRYLEALRHMPDYADNLKTLERVPAKGATTFREAVQSLWFTFSFVRLCGNWPGIGRLDVLLGDYLKNDLAAGRITLDAAREILAHFFIKGCEWIRGEVVGSGDAQHYQNIVLSGVDAAGNDVTNEVSYLVLDVVEELAIGDFPIAIRLNKNTNPAFLRRVVEVMRYGGGIVAVYNEELILKALQEYGYRAEDASRFANDGCWEVQIPGETAFLYSPFDGLQILQKQTLHNYEKTDFASFEALYQAFAEDLKKEVARMEENYLQWVLEEDRQTFRKSAPCTVVSIFEKDCIAKGLPYREGGTRYTVQSLHLGGVADIVNSLYAIKKLVFDDRVVTLSHLFEALRNDWRNEEPLRQIARSRYRYFGNDNAEADELYDRVIRDFAQDCKQHDKETPVWFPAGISTFGRQIEWAPHRLATPFGGRAGDVLAGNTSPTPGTDRAGVTSIIKSYCHADLTGMVSGTALDIQLMPASVAGTAGLEALESLLSGFVALGGFFMQIDVVDAGVLREAQLHPEQYQTLSVRVSGWNARFATLDRQWQDMVIKRAENRA